MPVYKITYEEYLHYEEFVESDSAENAQRVFERCIDTFEPVDAEVYTFDVINTQEDKEDTRYVANKKKRKK